MIWTALTCDKLKYAISNTDTLIEMNSPAGTVALCTLVGSPATKHVVLELYSAMGSEQVIAYACEAGKVKITRANGGTAARAWPVGGCLRTIQIIDGQLCGASDGAASDCGCVSDPWEGFTVCDSFTLNVSTPSAPVLCLKPTGVVAGVYCGLRINEFGQVVFIPPNFPASCLPVFDPCGDCSGGGVSGDAPSAANVPYLPQIGASIAVAGSVQLALEQLEDYVMANTGGSIGVTSVTGTSPISVTGSPTSRVVGHDQSPISAGTYNGFSVDDWGHITGYTAVVSGVTINATNGITASSSSPNVWDITASYATALVQGVVKFTPSGDIGSGVPVLTTNAVSYGNLTEWWTTKINAVCSQSNAAPLAAANRVSMCQSGNSVLATLSDVGVYLGVPHARLCFNSTSIMYGHNIAAVTSVAAGHVVSMSSPTALGEYQVIAHRQDGVIALPHITVSSTTSFIVEWVNPTNLAAVAPPTKLFVTVIGG